MASPAQLPADGRLARSERSRRAVADALLDLLAEGDPDPTAARIAHRAGVSLRSVFQLFDNLETLLVAAAESQMARIAPLLAPLDVGGSLRGRAARFAAQRAEVYEAIAAARRAALRLEAKSPTVARTLGEVRLAKRREAERVFAHELAGLSPAVRRDVIAALGAMASFSAWEDLRSHQGLTVARARKVLQRSIERLLGEASSPSAARGKR